ncbi:MAG: sporulation protein YqfD [Clostridia bacterium]|nr:sporulation protein YqfD [Clostridia bacterium]
MKELLSVQFTLTGWSAEKLLNEAGKLGIKLKRVRREKNRSITVRTSAHDYEAFCRLAAEKGFQVGKMKPVGLLRLLRMLKGRIGLWVGAAAGIGMLMFSFCFVWQVNIENAGPYEGEVRSYLEALDIRPGILRSKISLGDLRDQLEWRFPQVKWIRTAWTGTALSITLEQGTPPPETEDAGKAGNVVAAEDGLISRISTFAGTPLVKAGDFVRAGQILIVGEERGRNGENVPVKARGEAVARVWVSSQVRMPITEEASYPTGREFERRIIWTPFFSWSKEETPGYLTSDKEINILSLGGVWVPIQVIRETYKEVTLQKEARNLAEVKKEGKKAAILALNRALISEETVDKWINFGMIEGDNMMVTATAEVLRSIGRFQPY